MDDGHPIVIVGAGGHARVVAEAIGPGGVVGHLAPASRDDELLGPWLGDDRAGAGLAAAGHGFAIGIGFVDRAGAGRRASLLATWEARTLVVVVHPSAVVSPSATLAPGAFVAAGAVVGTGTTVGVGAIVNTGAIVDHDGRIGRNVHIGPGAVMSGDVRVADDTLVGVGATVRQGISIGAHSVIGAGAAVVSDVAARSTMLGVPARPVPS